MTWKGIDLQSTGVKVKCQQHPLSGLSLLIRKEVKSGENPEQVVWDKRGGVKEN